MKTKESLYVSFFGLIEYDPEKVETDTTVDFEKNSEEIWWNNQSAGECGASFIENEDGTIDVAVYEQYEEDGIYQSEVTFYQGAKRLSWGAFPGPQIGPEPQS